jgi:reactive chlorine resistance protein C
MAMLRLGLIVVLVWIGALKFADYEAEGIVPLVANSPLMSFFYHYPAPEYRQYMNREGEVIPAHPESPSHRFRFCFTGVIGSLWRSCFLSLPLP